jgi:hypothetical protein
MAERRRIRRRDGARHWTLLRDLDRPDALDRALRQPDRVEYVRQNQRVTQADAEIGEQVRALHSGPNPPVVHRMIERQTASLPRRRRPDADRAADALNDPSRPEGPAEPTTRGRRRADHADDDPPPGEGREAALRDEIEEAAHHDQRREEGGDEADAIRMPSSKVRNL